MSRRTRVDLSGGGLWSPRSNEVCLRRIGVLRVGRCVRRRMVCTQYGEPPLGAGQRQAAAGMSQSSQGPLTSSPTRALHRPTPPPSRLVNITDLGVACSPASPFHPPRTPPPPHYPACIADSPASAASASLDPRNQLHPPCVNHFESASATFVFTGPALDSRCRSTSPLGVRLPRLIDPVQHPRTSRGCTR